MEPGLQMTVGCVCVCVQIVTIENIFICSEMIFDELYSTQTSQSEHTNTRYKLKSLYPRVTELSYLHQWCTSYTVFKQEMSCLCLKISHHSAGSQLVKITRKAIIVHLSYRLLEVKKSHVGGNKES